MENRPASQLHITVAAVTKTEWGNPRILDHDLRLAKAAILYADRVKLCSMGAWMAGCLSSLGYFTLNQAQQLEILASIAEGLANHEPDYGTLASELRKFSQLFSRAPITLSRKQRIKRDTMQEKLPEIWEQLRAGFCQIHGTSGFEELGIAADRGLIELHPFSFTDSDGVVKEYVGAVEEMLSTRSTYPLLDEQTNDLVRAALREGKFSIENRVTRRSKQIGLAADLFDRLPVFDIEMDQLLDIREELHRPLTHFRSEMVKFANDIEAAPWDEGFIEDVENTYRGEVEPTLLEIEEQLSSISFREFWSRKIVDKVGYISASATFSAALGAIVAPWAGVAAAIAGSAIFVQAGSADLREKTNEIERNGLYFYYRMKKLKDELL